MAARRPVSHAVQAAGGPSRRSFLGWGVLGASGLSMGLAGCSAAGGAGDPNDFVFTFWGTGAERDAVTAVLEEAASAEGLNPRPQSIPQNYETRMNTLIAANTPPDAGYLTEAMAMRLGEQGQLVNIVDRPVFENYMPQAIHWYSDTGAVAQTCQESMTLFFDSAAARGAGVTVPTTVGSAWNWDQLVESADALTADSEGRRPSESGFDPDDIQRYGFAAPTGVPQLFTLLQSRGVDMFNEDGTATNLDSPEAIQLLQDINELITVHRVSPTPAQATTFGASASLLLASQRVAMVIEGTWGLLDLGQSDVDYDTGVLPNLGQYVTTTLSGATGVFNASQHQDFGVSLIDAMSDPSSVDLYSMGLWMPAVADYYTDDALIAQWTSGGAHPAGFRTAVVDTILEHGVSYPSYRVRDFTTISTTINNAIGPIVSTPGDVTQAAQQLASTVNGQMQGAFPDSAPA